METINQILQFLLDLGSTVLVPAMIFILGLIFRQKPSKALKSGILIGIAFVMINILLGGLLGSVVPAAQAMVERTGVQLTTIDIGWAVAGTIAFASRYGLFIIPVAFAVNFVMLAFRLTKTINIDIWNFWHFAYIGATVEALTGSFVAGWGAAILLEVASLIGADISQKKLSEFAGLPGVSFTTSPLIGHMAFAWLGNKVLDTIFPRLKEVKVTPEKLQERLGILGEPWLHGVLVGGLVGILAGYDVKGILQLAITVAAIVFVFPRVINILMEGLMPLSDAAKGFADRFAGREIYIGIDWITLCKPSHITLGLLFMPITLGLAFILPGNTTLPLADLAFVFAFVWVVLPYVDGDLVKSFILGVIAIAAGLYIATWQAPDFTQAAIAAGQEIPEGAVQITNLFKGCDYPTTIIYGVFKLLASVLR
jgi:PTS system galactitol-specific IIC component